MFLKSLAVSTEDILELLLGSLCSARHYGSKMPYVLVRESFINSYCSVEGLPLNEGKILGKIFSFLLFNLMVLFRIFRIIKHFKRLNSR